MIINSMKNISNVKNCYGCGVCATACTKNAINITLSDHGFYVPVLNTERCINCGICVDVCAFLHDELSVTNKPKHSYGAWSNNPMVRKRSSSGGVGYELGKYALSQGYKVCGVRYNPLNKRAEHFIASNESELMYTVGSKYIQSYTVDGFKSIMRNEKYLVTGTPCQIDSFRRYIRKFNIEGDFILMDFFCHSVPSLLAWEKYLQIVEKKIGPIVYASWRNKMTGWHDSWAIAIDGNFLPYSRCEKSKFDRHNIYSPELEHSYVSRLSDGDLFYNLFLGDFCCNKACHKSCKYKYDKSSADIRIGDFWGNTYASDNDGVSAVAVFTEKGNELLKKLYCTMTEYPFEIVAEGQMKSNATEALASPFIWKLLRSNKEYPEVIWKIVVKLGRLIELPIKLIRKIL